MNKILIVEDEEAIRDLIKIELEMSGYKTDIASDGEVGADLIETNKYDFAAVVKDYVSGKTAGKDVYVHYGPVPIEADIRRADRVRIW